jgi:RNA-directed DNA polymerase
VLAAVQPCASRTVWNAKELRQGSERLCATDGQIDDHSPNPYDPAWELYFEERLAMQMASTLTGRGTARYLWLEQDGKCLVCGQLLTLEAGWHMHHLLWRSHGGGHDADNLVLLHPNCHRQVHSEGLVVNKAVSREGRL